VAAVVVGAVTAGAALYAYGAVVGGSFIGGFVEGIWKGIWKGRIWKGQADYTRGRKAGFGA
jgi:hypothetical protein